ncbi:MAG: RNA polymerase sigma factor, partial [Verrucomicrobiia bacterium]
TTSQHSSTELAGPPDERELIARCRRGDSAAWDELFERYYDSVGRFIFQYSPAFTREDVEEIAQEVFLATVRNIDSFRGKSAFQTWLFRIAINKARDFIQHKSAAKRGKGMEHVPLDIPGPNNSIPLEIPSTTPGPDQALISDEEMVLLRQAVDRLSDPCREIIELRYFGDLSYEELAATLNLNLKTVSSRLSKCLDRLEEIARPLFAGEKTRPFSV